MNYRHGEMLLRTEQEESYVLGQLTRVTLIGALIDLLLGVTKIICGLVDNSQALVADGVHSLSDLVTDGIVLVAIRQSRKQADEDHPYGHARIETIATVFLAISLFLVALGIAADAIISLEDPVGAVTPGWMAFTVVVISALSKEFIFRYTMRVAKRHDSQILMANAWHSRTDAISSLIVFVGISGALLGIPALDAIAAMGVACIIAKVAWDLGVPGVQELVDKGVDGSYLSELEEVVRSTSGVKTFHALRTRRMGPDVLVDIHVSVAPLITVSEGHQIADRVENRIIHQFGEINDVTVHIDADIDKLGEAAQVLPDRKELLDQLNVGWNAFEPARQIERTNIHYLESVIVLEVILPLSLASSLPEAQNIGDEIRRLAMDAVPQINDVQVLFAS
ncbi:MAG: cation diffusion facilitator family transporter [Candidatus Azotimanducaceae bacterium]|jgi:cation diffusion facilitator family transporter